MTPHHRQRGFHGPRCWAVSLAAGLIAGAVLAVAIPGHYGLRAALVPVWLVTPFAALLGGIALMPFIHARFWHRHYPDAALLLAGLVAGYYLMAFRQPPGDTPGGAPAVLHALREYYSFIALVGGLFIVSGGILVDVRGRATPVFNTAILLAGSILANIIGTTGASVLLIRPFMRINRGRLRPLHIVFFIFLISNCAGCLTPIGDPPLYLGYLLGVPFFWTLAHLWPSWMLTVGLVLLVFLAYDGGVQRRHEETFSPLPTTDEAGNLMEAEIHARPGLRLGGAAGIACLALMIAGVFIDPLIEARAGYRGFPIGATFQIAVAALAHRLAPRPILAANDFTFGPIKEVALLFLGIFITMVPALDYLSAHGSELRINTPTAFYFASGALSAVLDNAPTYANFLQVAFGSEPINATTVRHFLATQAGPSTLAAISTGAVFFGAMTYIGNGPNFMVKAIAESSGVVMPSFFGYVARALLILLPILIIHWLVFIR